MKRLTLAALLLLSTAVPAPAGASTSPPGCRDWQLPATERTLTVGSVSELLHAVKTATPDTTILLEDGDYLLPRMLDLATPNVVLAGKSRDAARVFLHGTGMNERTVGVALSVSAPRVTIAHLTIGKVGYHGIQIRGERAASHATVFGVRIFDTGQQLLKGSSGRNGRYADEGLVACSTFEYTHHAPSDYTNGIDVLAAKGWVVRDNRIRRIRGPRGGGWKAGPAILFWASSIDTVVERNLVADSYRGIAFGLGPGTSQRSRDDERVFDHQGGVIRNNVVVNLEAWADEGIEVSAARDVTIDHNTVVVEGRLPWSISARFPTTSGRARNNLTNRGVVRRNGGTIELAGNVSGARTDWFVDLAAGDARLAGPGLPPVNAGVPVTGVGTDFTGGPRSSGGAPDAGAHELPMSES